MLGEQASVSENGTVKTPRRAREYLTEGEIDRLMTIARQSDRYGHRDATAILVAFRHGLRSSELVALEWDQIDLTRKTIRLWRVKGGDPSTHYLSNSELRALRRLQRENPPGPHVFVSERGGPVTTGWFRKMMARLGEKADMPFPIHPTNFGIHAAISSRTKARTPVPYKHIWVTAPSTAPCGTR